MPFIVHGCTTSRLGAQAGASLFSRLGAQAGAHPFGRLDAQTCAHLFGRLSTQTSAYFIVLVPHWPVAAQGSSNCSSRQRAWYAHTRQIRFSASYHEAGPSSHCSVTIAQYISGRSHRPNWWDAMIEEFTTLQANNTWDLVPRPSDGNIVIGKWVFRHKFHPDGSLDRYKA
jgi:hypothetical protein